MKIKWHSDDLLQSLQNLKRDTMRYMTNISSSDEITFSSGIDEDRGIWVEWEIGDRSLLAEIGTHLQEHSLVFCNNVNDFEEEEEEEEFNILFDTDRTMKLYLEDEAFDALVGKEE